jgi:hypothetical protein
LGTLDRSIDSLERALLKSEAVIAQERAHQVALCDRWIPSKWRPLTVAGR